MSIQTPQTSLRSDVMWLAFQAVSALAVGLWAAYLIESPVLAVIVIVIVAIIVGFGVDGLRRKRRKRH